MPTVGANDLRELRRLYDQAVKAGADTFMFQGQIVLTSYAKYLLEYLEGEVKRVR